ncbi:MAG: sulfotransferase family 2 domain-containing protein [Pseudomonadota bacterium]
MPLFKINSDLHFFAHVPKCAGASVEVYLRKRFGEIAFQNSRYLSLTEEQRWTRSSPQHVDVASLELLIPRKWLASSFAVVRHPVSRLRSAFDFQRVGEKSIPEDTDINDWLANWAKTRAAQPFQFDNHARPAHDLIPKGATVFRLEDGIDGIVAHLDRLEGQKRGPRALPHENKSRGGSDYAAAQSPLTDASMALIQEIYKVDFDRFGYACEDVSKSKPVTTRRPKRPSRKSLTQLLGLKK